MRRMQTRLFPTSMAVACLFLAASISSADRDKNESGKDKNRDGYEHELEYDGRWDEEDWDAGSSYAPNSAWSGGGSWEGSRGGVIVQVYGGSPSYPSHGHCAEPRHRYNDAGYRHCRAHRIPPGHLPPPGECRVWLFDRPAGHQPPPTSCRQAERYAYRYGGCVIYGGPSH